jgi:transposase
MSPRSQRPRVRSFQGAARPFDGMRTINTHAAGVDRDAQAIVAGVPDGDAHPLVRAFGSSTAALDALADWCVARGIPTAALAATRGYGMPLFATLAARGIQCWLRSAQAITHVPGRTSAVRDCQWMHTVHSSGLLQAACRPEAALVALRTLLRQRAPRLAPRAPHVLHRPKALWQMTIPWSQVRSDGTGATGQRILRALVAGERDPRPLAA